MLTRVDESGDHLWSVPDKDDPADAPGWENFGGIANDTLRRHVQIREIRRSITVFR